MSDRIEKKKMKKWVVVLLHLELLLLFLNGAEASFSSSSSPSSTSCFPAMFVLADSLSDTGNAALSGVLKVTMPPYGITFPHYPFNRYSDGRLIVDFLAEALGLPFLHPCLNASEDFLGGVNYAVGGATALNASFLQTTFNLLPLTPHSLEVQLNWHLDFKAAVNASADTLQSSARTLPDLAAFTNGLYLIEIGGNDYMLAFEALYTPAYVKNTLVPLVMQKIREVTEALYNSGARNFLLMGITPLGCEPSLLATYVSAMDSDGCLMDYNSVAYEHSMSLLDEVKRLRATHPDANFVFADYYGAYTAIMRNKTSFGFSTALDACCGAGPSFPYNYDAALPCNITALYVCSDPNEFLSWDGVHHTDKFNLAIADQFISGSFLDPPHMSLISCPSWSSS